jgi:hypothetical protein
VDGQWLIAALELKRPKLDFFFSHAVLRRRCLS